MNKLIKQLDQRAVDYAMSVCDANGVYKGKEYLTVVKEKFAELILLEVTDILSTYRGKIVFEDGAEYNYEHPIIAIRKHFGVKG